MSGLSTELGEMTKTFQPQRLLVTKIHSFPQLHRQGQQSITRHTYSSEFHQEEVELKYTTKIIWLKTVICYMLVWACSLPTLTARSKLTSFPSSVIWATAHHTTKDYAHGQVIVLSHWLCTHNSIRFNHRFSPWPKQISIFLISMNLYLPIYSYCYATTNKLSIDL